MGSCILCHEKHAREPYEIQREHVRIYTLEELCYYLSQHLYVIDFTLMNQHFCDWIEQELGMEKLAQNLRDGIALPCTEEQFVLMILQASGIYSDKELSGMESILTQLQNQRDVEKLKAKADHLMEEKEYAYASLEYQAILNQEWDDSLEQEFYGRVYACLGAAYGKLFLYEDAADAYQNAYRLCEEEGILKAYLYCCKKVLPQKEYAKLLSGNAQYLHEDTELKINQQRARREEDYDLTDQNLEAWEKNYR